MLKSSSEGIVGGWVSITFLFRFIWVEKSFHTENRLYILSLKIVLFDCGVRKFQPITLLLPAYVRLSWAVQIYQISRDFILMFISYLRITINRDMITHKIVEIK